MREPLVSKTPPFYPGVCVGCGVQSNRRWYVELGIDLDFHFNPMHEGNIILCNLCWNALVKSVNKYVKTFVESNKGMLDISPRTNGLSDGSTNRVNENNDADNQNAERNDPGIELSPEPSDPGESTDKPKLEFREFFAGINAE